MLNAFLIDGTKALGVPWGYTGAVSSVTEQGHTMVYWSIQQTRTCACVSNGTTSETGTAVCYISNSVCVELLVLILLCQTRWLTREPVELTQCLWATWCGYRAAERDWSLFHTLSPLYHCLILSSLNAMIWSQSTHCPVQGCRLLSLRIRMRQFGTM